MTHLSEEELVLHYYGEDDAPLALVSEQHLEGCPECRALYGSLQRVLNVMDGLPVPERGPEYGAEVWQRMAGRLPRRRMFLLPGWRWGLAAACTVVLMTGAFLAGRYSPRTTEPLARDRVLRVAVGDYLDRSQMVLSELANADPKQPLDISAEQERAEDLISEARLYRQTATATGNAPVAALLDEIERVLLEVARGPAPLSGRQVEEFRERLDAENMMFKIRVVNTNVRRL